MRDFIKKALLFVLLLFIFFSSILAQVNQNHVYVNGYYRSNGTYVKGHYRTSPNSTNRDNFSTSGNTNPYTGKPGYIRPDNKPYNPTYIHYENIYSNTRLKSKYKRNNAILYHNKYSLKSRKEIETFLDKIGLYPGLIDGYFTTQTIRAIRELQTIINVTPDGRFGPNTLNRIEELVNKK